MGNKSNGNDGRQAPDCLDDFNTRRPGESEGLDALIRRRSVLGACARGCLVGGTVGLLLGNIVRVNNITTIKRGGPGDNQESVTHSGPIDMAPYTGLAGLFFGTVYSYRSAHEYNRNVETAAEQLRAHGVTRRSILGLDKT